MYRITRVSTSPDSPIRIWVDGPVSDPAGQFARGGRFEFYPAGSEDGPDSYQVSDYAAAAIMGDPGIAGHFKSDPPWQPQAATQDESKKQPAVNGGRRRGRGLEGESTPTKGE